MNIILKKRLNDIQCKVFKKALIKKIGFIEYENYKSKLMKMNNYDLLNGKKFHLKEFEVEFLSLVYEDIKYNHSEKRILIN